jgi:hypothetical protein
MKNPSELIAFIALHVFVSIKNISLAQPFAAAGAVPPFPTEDGCCPRRRGTGDSAALAVCGGGRCVFCSGKKWILGEAKSLRRRLSVTGIGAVGADERRAPSSGRRRRPMCLRRTL